MRAAQPVVTLVDISKLRIEVYVTQDIAMRAGELKSVSLVFDHKPDEVFRADVVECARSTTSNNLSYLLTALLPKTPVGHIGQGVFRIARQGVPGRCRAPIGALPPPFGRRFRMEDRPCDGDCYPSAYYARRIASRRYNVRNIGPFGR